MSDLSLPSHGHAGPTAPASSARARRYLMMVHTSYAYEILRPVQQAIVTRGGEVAWYLWREPASSLRVGERQLASTDAVVAFAPDAVLVPGNWVPPFFPGLKVHVFHGLAIDRTGRSGPYRGYQRDRGPFDLYCTPAPEVTAIFQRDAARHGTFAVAETGFPKLDPLFIGGSVGTRSDRPTVLYASTWDPRYSSARALHSTIRRLQLEGPWRWIVTLHPLMAQSVVEGYRALAGPNLDFVECRDGVLPLLQAANVLVSDTSSIVAEFMLLDKPVVTFRTRAPGPHLIDVRSPDQIATAIAHALSRPKPVLEAARAYADVAHPYRDGRSGARLLDAVERMLASPPRLAPRPWTPWRDYRIRRSIARSEAERLRS